MEAGGFSLGKWASNFNQILENVSEDQREVNYPFEINGDESIKTLGVTWNPSSDCFQYRVTLSPTVSNPTKRTVLSEVASLFDPLGLLAPLVISEKKFLQKLWAEGMGWDFTSSLGQGLDRISLRSFGYSPTQHTLLAWIQQNQ